MESKLLTYMFDFELWKTELPEFLEEKHINVTLGKQLCTPQVRLRMYLATRDGQYEISPPYAALIPKDKPGEFRRVWINETPDRWWLRLANCALNYYCRSMISPFVTSYQRGLGTQETVQNISREIVRLDKIRKDKVIGVKIDLHHFFDEVPLSIINEVFDRIEGLLEIEHNTDPVINTLREYYNSDLVFDEDGNLIHLFTSLKQGSSISGFLANVCLRDFDDKISQLGTYCRYSDDLVLFNDKAEETLEIIKTELAKKNLKVNPRKVEFLRSDVWFKFLGFNIKGNLITLSKNRVKKLQKEITNRTINKPNVTYNQARRNVINYLYNGEYCWATSCLGTINVKPDIDELNLFIVDCLRACKVRETKKRKGKISVSKIGGLGSVTDLPDKTILRGTGHNVTSNRNKTDKYLENYLTIGCLSNAMKISKPVYQACVRSM